MGNGANKAIVTTTLLRYSGQLSHQGEFHFASFAMLTDDCTPLQTKVLVLNHLNVKRCHKQRDWFQLSRANCEKVKGEQWRQRFKQWRRVGKLKFDLHSLNLLRSALQFSCLKMFYFFILFLRFLVFWQEKKTLSTFWLSILRGME